MKNISYIYNVIKRENMKIFRGKVSKEYLGKKSFYFVDIPFRGSIFIDKNDFPIVKTLINKEVEIKTIVQNPNTKSMDKYKVVDIKFKK